MIRGLRDRPAPRNGQWQRCRRPIGVHVNPRIAANMVQLTHHADYDTEMGQPQTLPGRQARDGVSNLPRRCPSRAVVAFVRQRRTGSVEPSSEIVRRKEILSCYCISASYCGVGGWGGYTLLLTKRNMTITRSIKSSISSSVSPWRRKGWTLHGTHRQPRNKKWGHMQRRGRGQGL